MISGFKRKAAQLMALAMLLLPLQKTKIPAGNSGQAGESEDVGQIFSDELNHEYTNYIVNQTNAQRDLGIHLDGVKNKLLTSNQTNQTIKFVLEEDPTMVEISRFFQPSQNDNETKTALENYPILVGQDIDYYLETIRKGSWGTTVMTVGSTGEVHFDSISLKSALVSVDYQDKGESLQKLVREEFFQAHQYDAVAATLFNNGYFTLKANLRSPEALAKELSVGNLRAFLELFPQQKYLTDKGFGSNSYNFYIGSHLFTGETAARATVDDAYDGLANFIQDKLEIEVNPAMFIDPKQVERINDAFRERYMSYYVSKGFSDTEVQIWNLVGMKRFNRTDETNSLDIKAILDLP